MLEKLPNALGGAKAGEGSEGLVGMEASLSWEGLSFLIKIGSQIVS